MKNTTFSIIFILAAFLLTGCRTARPGDTADIVSREVVANMRELGMILNGVTDETSAAAAVPKIKDARAQLRDAARRNKQVPKVDAREAERIGRTMEAGARAAIADIAAARTRLQARPDLLAIIEPALKNIENDL